MNTAMQERVVDAADTRRAEPSAYRALVVEDNPGDQYLMQRMLLRLGIEAQIAGTGDDAMQLARSARPDIVFLDVILPEQTGYSLAERIRALYPDSYIPIVFVTALSDDDVILRCFAAGGDDVITKPVDPAILSARTEAALRSRRLHEILAGQRDQLLTFQNEISRDVDVTKSILDNCSTTDALNAPNVRYVMRPVETLNGDFIMAARKPSRAQCFIVGDFTGHGLPAAVGVMIVHGVFISMVAKGFDIVTIAHEINRKMHTLLPTNRFLSAALFEIDPQSNIMAVWNAGLPALLVRGDERRISAQFPSCALPLGILPPHEFTARASHIVLSPNDRVYAYSDGIVETSNTSGEMFGQERLQAALETDVDDTLGHLFAAVETFANGQPAHDDLSCLEVRFEPQALLSLARGDDLPSPVRNTAAGWRLGIDIDYLTVRSVEPLSALVSMIDTLQGFGPRGGEIYLVVSELYSNAVDYGLLGLGDLRAAGRGGADLFLERQRRLAALEAGTVRIVFQHYAEPDGGALDITVSHDGEGFDYEARIELAHDNGPSEVCGISLVRSLCENLHYSDGGRSVTARYRWRDGRDA
ncbi:MAG: SpoIIE family protein phosphatase [Gammaproteobacteria bacterium]